MTDQERTMAPDVTAPSEGKKPYATPSLTLHGTIEEITQTIGLTTADGLTGSNIV